MITNSFISADYKLGYVTSRDDAAIVILDTLLNIEESSIFFNPDLHIDLEKFIFGDPDLSDVIKYIENRLVKYADFITINKDYTSFTYNSSISKFVLNLYYLVDGEIAPTNRIFTY